jgi:hypothetical protein
MRRLLCVLTIGFVLALGPVSPALGQDFILPYNKTPETAPEFWAAAKNELGLGNYNRVADMLRRFYERLVALGEDEQTKLLLSIYDQDGLSPLLRMSNLETVRKVKIAAGEGEKEAPLGDIVVQRITKAIHSRLADPQRILFFVNNLSKAPHERSYALSQLRMAGAMAVPPMIGVLADAARQREHEYIIDALVKMPKDSVLPMLAALDAPDDGLRLALISVFNQRADARIVPYLWYFSASPKASAALRNAASNALVQFQKTLRLPTGDPRAMLTKEAESYYQHKAEIVAPTAPMVWSWADGSVVGQPATPSQYEEFYGLFWAKKALDLDPQYLPAQVVFLSLAIEKSLERGGLATPLETSDPSLASLLAGTSRSVLEAVVDKALAEGRSAAALGALQGLRTNGEGGLLRSTDRGAPAVVRALTYPDRRVQLAAAEAAINVPTKEAYPGSHRVIEVLRRALTSDAPAKAFIVHTQLREAQQLAGLAKQAGLAAEVFPSGEALLRAAQDAGDLALIIADAKLTDPGITYFLSQARNSPATSGVPIVLVAPEGQERAAKAAAERFPRMLVLAPPPATADLLKLQLAPLFMDPAQAPLSDAERKNHAQTALNLLGRLARGENGGYDLRPIETALTKALANDALASQAAQVLSFRPGKENQAALADLVLQSVRSPAIRAAGARALRDHWQRFGLALSPERIRSLLALATEAHDPDFAEQVLRLSAGLQPDAKRDGDRLREFTPRPAAPAKPNDAKEPTEEKRDDK